MALARRHGGAAGTVRIAPDRRRRYCARACLGGGDGRGLVPRAPRRGRFRPCRRSGTADRARRALPCSRPLRRADTRAARRSADGAQLLLGRYPRRAHAHGLDLGVEIGQSPDREAPANRGRLAARHAAHRMGHRQHAHRRRRHRPGPRADGGEADMGQRQPPCHRLRDHPRNRAWAAARRCHAAGVGLFPRCLPGPDRAGRLGRARGDGAGRAGRREPRRRAGPARRAAGPRLRLETRGLWRGATGPDRRADLGRQGGSRRSLP